MNANSLILSFGLADDVSFEIEAIKRFGCRVIGFDPTPRSEAYIKNNIKDEAFTYKSIALAEHDGRLTFRTAADGNISLSAVAEYNSAQDETLNLPCQKLGSIMSDLMITKISLLKLDIEGSEYSVIDQICSENLLQHVDQLLVEFHHFLPGISVKDTIKSVQLIKKAGFSIEWVGRTNHEYLFVKTAA
jgi:FkbM family methyltransferase